MEFVPTCLDDFIINKDIALILKKFSIDTILNTIVYGKNNSGKKTLVDALLNHLFNTDIHLQKKLESTELKIGNNKVDIDYISSTYHFEINLYEYGLYDSDIITDFIYNIVKYKSMNQYPYRLLIINHFDRITRLAQLKLMKIMEKCYNTCRIILICEELNNLNSSFFSRCFLLRVPLPKPLEIKQYVSHISKGKHKFTQSQQQRIFNQCNNDMYLLNNIISAMVANPKFNYNKMEDINRDIQKIYRLIEIPNIISIIEIRSICYNLLLLNFPMKKLFIKICDNYIQKLDEKNRLEFLEFSAQTNSDMNKIEHDIISIEYLILKVKKLLINK